MKLQDLRLAEQLRKDKRSLAETAVTSYLNNAGLKTRYDFEKQEVTVLLGQHAERARISINCIVKDLRDAGYAVSDPKDVKVDGMDAVAFKTVEEEPVATGQEEVKPEKFDQAAGMIKGGKNYSTESRLLTLEALSYELPAAAKATVERLLVQAEAAFMDNQSDQVAACIAKVEQVLANPSIKLEGDDAAPEGGDEGAPAPAEGDDEQGGAAPTDGDEMAEAHVTWMDGKIERVGRVVAYNEEAGAAQVEVVNSKDGVAECVRLMVKVERLSMIELGEAFKVAFRNRRLKFNLLY